MGRNIQVAVIDVAGFMRDGLCALLSEQDELEVLGAIDNDPQAIASAALTTPDVALMALSTTGQTGLALGALRKRWPGAHVLVLTSEGENPLVDAVMHAGIAGYVFKSSSRAELVSAIRSVSGGHRYLGRPGYDAPPSGHLLREALPTLPRNRGPGTLSEREREVMRLIAEGYRTREMAQQLSLSHKTIEKHRSNLMRKLGLRSATAVAAYAISHGYVVLAT